MRHVAKLVLSLTAVVAIMSCAQYEKPSLTGRWRLYRLTKTLSFRPGSIYVINIPGELEGCQLDLDGHFTFTPSEDDSNRGELEANVVITNHCFPDPEVKDVLSPYLYDEDTGKLLIPGYYPFPFKVVTLTHDKLVIFYTVTYESVTATHTFEFVRD